MSKYIFEALDSKEDKLRTAKEKLEDQRKELWNSQDKEMRDILVSYFEGTEGIETNLEDLDYRGSVDYITISCKGDEFEKEVWNEEKEDYEKVIKHRSYELCTIYTTTEKIKEHKRIQFLKTHSCLGLYKGKPFTTPDYSLGGIYIVRDPRNVISSIKNHFSMNDDEAYRFITNPNTSAKEINSLDYRTWVLLSNWSNHYRSWIKSKNFRKLLIKYEDFEEDKYRTFRDIVIYVNALTNRTERINDSKLKKAIESTNFNVLKNKEKNNGFEEAAFDAKDTNKRKVFFNLGFNNKWEKLLDQETRKKIENEFEIEMEELGYL